MTRKLSIHTDVTRYVAKHGHRPKGENEWVFESEDGKQRVVFIGPYWSARADMVALAKAAAPEQRRYVVYVRP